MRSLWLQGVRPEQGAAKCCTPGTPITQRPQDKEDRAWFQGQHQGDSLAVEAEAVTPCCSGLVQAPASMALESEAEELLFGFLICLGIQFKADSGPQRCAGYGQPVGPGGRPSALPGFGRGPPDTIMRMDKQRLCGHWPHLLDVNNTVMVFITSSASPIDTREAFKVSCSIPAAPEELPTRLFWLYSLFAGPTAIEGLGLPLKELLLGARFLPVDITEIINPKPCNIANRKFPLAPLTPEILASTEFLTLSPTLHPDRPQPRMDLLIRRCASYNMLLCRAPASKGPVRLSAERQSSALQSPEAERRPEPQTSDASKLLSPLGASPNSGGEVSRSGDFSGTSGKGKSLRTETEATWPGASWELQFSCLGLLYPQAKRSGPVARVATDAGRQAGAWFSTRSVRPETLLSHLHSNREQRPLGVGA
ncbi:unnamed protein product [Rangifer tarandus platyrhynchus]|uniref:Uncharacterized protein n=1 Tax=Rangifer tarandus platyrhynchus TaxID=3082113 RepID=A0ABN8YRA4_RANTA|nr:unnamed protein product [Rangifer tarandus platyrhynchus]